ncbi:HET-domain-containing protein [Hypoxylon sp. FL1857]|nr:HET-domain-containing protein [Hypoxylon sp. FL1857]
MIKRRSALSAGDDIGLDSSDARKKQNVSPSPSSADDHVCQRCLSVNWDEVALDSGEGRYIFEVKESHESLRSSTCRICRMISAIKPPSLDHCSCSLYAFSAAQYMVGRRAKQPSVMEDSRLLGVFDTFIPFRDRCHEQGVIGVFRLGQSYDYGIRSTKRDSADFTLMKECLDRCRRIHGAKCTPGKTPIRGLRMIDCMAPDRGIVEAPQNCRYAALSYVWGSQSANSMKSSVAAYSQVVEDAISAALAMDIQYLWVDRHCIDQGNATDKHDQISQMGSIYANSEVTFIAAAGDNNAYGLPGVGTTTRRQQRREIIDNVVFLQGFLHSAGSIRSSRWASRAWTFQECFFSPRRVIFTDNDVSYLCSSLYHSDRMEQPRDTYGYTSIVPFSDLTLGGRGDWPAWLMEYSRRALTYDEDALNAFQGILKYMQRDGNRSRLGDGFPSWSYIGWAGPMRFLELNDLKMLFEASLGNKEKPFVQVNPLGFGSCFQDGDIEHRYLHLTGKVVELSLTDIRWSGTPRSKMATTVHMSSRGLVVLWQASDGLYAQLRLTADLNILARVYLDALNLVSRKVLLFVLYREGMELLYGLVLHPLGNTYRRVGIVAFNVGDSGNFDHRLALTNGDGQYLDEARLNYLPSQGGREPLWLDDAERRAVVVG